MFGSPLEGGFGEFAVAKAIVPGQRRRSGDDNPLKHDDNHV
jgi:hypothetical protein